MSTNNICFHGEIRKISILFCKKKITLSGALEDTTSPKDYKLFSCSTQLSMKFSLLINMKMPTEVYHTVN